MVVDTSAVLAILLNEEDAPVYAEALAAGRPRRMSAGNYLETAIVIDNRGDAIARREFDRFIRRAAIELESFTPEQAEIARQAYRDFGKGRHPAALNLGDCLAYALAKVMDEPLLFKGNDFGQTDVETALARE